ncbi:MAG: hypothetical protein KAT75_02540 [Dehalococcoidia bacterium]|nr:hypothetical protein [Dehalococcoidia bacterium]
MIAVADVHDTTTIPSSYCPNWYRRKRQLKMSSDTPVCGGKFGLLLEES